MSTLKNYKHTIYACYTGYIVQAIVNNFAPLLFLTFRSQYGISLDKIALLTTFNFGIQLLVDLICAKVADKIGYRILAVAAHIFAAAGLVFLAVLPEILPAPFVGICIAVTVYAIGGGLLEVLISPIVEACPTNSKSGAMSLLHSFYCWGSVFVIGVSTLFFALFGTQNWQILALFWALIPIANSVYFSKVPIHTLVESGESMSFTQLFKTGIFWVLLLMMVASGAAEQGMSQWASAFAESGLRIDKTTGDLLGPCMFSLLMGLTRLFYGKCSHKIRLAPFMTGCAILCAIGYLLAALSSHPALGLAGCALCGLSVGIMWPGTFSTASKTLKTGGTAMFALLALAGDLGCTAGPAAVGTISDWFGDDLKKGLLAAAIFPLLLIVGILLSRRGARQSMSK